jgi:hypothetical protein
MCWGWGSYGQVRSFRPVRFHHRFSLTIGTFFTSNNDDTVQLGLGAGTGSRTVPAAVSRSSFAGGVRFVVAGYVSARTHVSVWGLDAP